MSDSSLLSAAGADSASKLRRRTGEAAIENGALWGVFGPDSNGRPVITKTAAAQGAYVGLSLDAKERAVPAGPSGGAVERDAVTEA